MADFKNRIIRAIKLDAGLYREVKTDKQALNQATGIVVFFSVAVSVCMYRIGIIKSMGMGGVLLGIFGALILWYARAYFVFLIGTYLICEPQAKTDIGQLLRVLGFSFSPGIIMMLGIIPPLAPVVLLISVPWMLAAMVIAVREAFGYKSLWRAIGVCLVIVIIQMVIDKFLFSLIRNSGQIDLPLSTGSILTPKQ